MPWFDLVAPLMVIGSMGEIFYFIVSSDTVRGNRQGRAHFPPTRRDIEALARLWRRLWSHRMRLAPPAHLSQSS
jgi:hypothetical protein